MAGVGAESTRFPFDEPISQAEVLEIRRYAELFEQRERQTLRDQVRRWVTGEP